ncbi:hypothetical protein G7046_g2786 [Stylonectria norvegica]|nr:hypothetical protein G7046_g2786 [Stylonectria norvegica]
MPFSLPPFLARLAGPFHQSARMSIAAESPSSVSSTTNTQLCTVAAGCFWGIEHVYRKNFAGKGLIDAQVGYIGGSKTEPSYSAVCSGKTGHAEAAQITFDPEQVSYRQLIEFFYRMHDPTTPNAQGPDKGTQYRSGIYYHDEEQRKIAEDVTAKVAAQWWKDAPISTEIVPAGKWWTAEKYHQLYLDKNPAGEAWNYGVGVWTLQQTW